MQNITSLAGLKKAIQFLEVEQIVKSQQLKEQFYLTYESFKPINLLKSALRNITSSSNLTNKILSAAGGLAVGYFLKK